MSQLSKVAAFGVINLAVLLFAIFHSYQLNETFYASSVYFAESKICMIVLGTFGLYCMFLLARWVKTFFLGPLRLIEREHIAEYSWITLSETFLAMTIFKNEIDSIFVFSFATLFCFKIFQWIIRDRIEFMEQIVTLPKDFVIKVGTLLSMLLFGSSFMMTGNIIKVARSGPSMAILFANEYALTNVSLIGSAIRFALNCIDAFNPEGAFEHRSTILFYMDFFVDLFKLLIYSVFFGVVMMYYGLPIHIIRDLYVTVISFTKRVRDMIRYHQIMSSLQTRYPDATAEELEMCTDKTCIICREEMAVEVKRLPCGHFFHFKCLKSWLERQQVCPTCRKSVLEVTKEPIRPIIVHHYSQSASTESFSAQSPTLVPPENIANSLSRSHSHAQSLSNASSTRLMMSPLRRTASTSNVLSVQPVQALHYPEDNNPDTEKEHLLSEHERLVIAADLERIGRRSRSPLSSVQNGGSPSYFDAPSRSFNNSMATFSDECPLSPLSHVKSRIEYVEDLMTEHENILHKLRKVEEDLILERNLKDQNEKDRDN